MKSKKLLSLGLCLLLFVGMLPMSNITVFATTPHSHCVCGGNTNIGDHTEHTDITFTEWTFTDSMPTETGNYVLMNDVTITDTWKPAIGVTTLCLNGHTLTYSGNAINEAIQIASATNIADNRTLNICDCSNNSGKIIGGKNSGIVVAENGVLNLYNGKICNNRSPYTCGGIYLNRSTFNMYGGAVSNNSAEDGNAGGLMLDVSSKFNMYGGIISANTASNFGGGVFVTNSATFKMQNGIISENQSGETGGGVHNNGTFIINGGTITENISTNSTGGGVWSANDTTISISGDTIITENTGSSTTNNLHLASDGTDDAKIAVGTMETTASVGVSTDTNHSKEISVGGKDYKESFFSDNGAYIVVADGDNLKFVEKTVQVGKVTLNNGEYTTDGETKTADTPTGEGYAYYKDGVLTLNNFTYSGGSVNSNLDIAYKLAAIFCEYDLTIKVEGRNSITREVTGTDTDTDAVLRGILVRSGELKIIGDDKEDFLEVIAYGHENIPSYAVDGNSEGVVIENCTLEAKSATGGAGLYVAGDVSITGAEVLGSSGIANDYRDAFGIYTVTLKITDSDVVGIAEDNAGGDAKGIYLDSNTAKLIFESGSIVAETSDVSDDSYAVYVNKKDNITLPAKYWMRNSDSGEYVKGTWDGANVSSYFELTTTKQSGSITDISNMDKVYDGVAVSAPEVTSLSTGTKTFKYKARGAEDSSCTTEAPENAGEYTCLVTVADDGYYTETTATNDFEITKATPTITTPPTASRIASGSRLENSNLTNGVASVDGTFVWSDGTKEMTTTGDILEKVIFTPTDSVNYNTAECDVTVNVYRRSSGGGGTSRYTVKFDTNGGSAVKSVTVTRNNKVSEPEKPTNGNAVFRGWYTDKELTKEYDFDSKVTRSFTLYAKWSYGDGTPGAWVNPFEDIAQEYWFYEDIKYVYENKLMHGTANTTFAPGLEITRGMLITILYRAEGEPDVNNEMPFADIKADDYFANAVIWAYYNGIVNGITDTEFAPNANITREQMASILYRYAQYKDYDVSVGEDTNILSYADVDKISEYAIPAMQWACGDAIISGKGGGILDPTGNATRAEAAAILARFIKNI